MKIKLKSLSFSILMLLQPSAFAAFSLTADGFTNNGDGTVTDNNTGLVWQACAVGQTFNQSTGSCDGEADTYTYKDAMKLTSDFAGKTDWRLPDIKELQSIVDLRKTNPAINKSLFPNPVTKTFLSSSLYFDEYYKKYSDYYSWGVNFYDGNQETPYSTSEYPVRLVRGTTNNDSFLSLNDFTDNGDGTVTHTKTGLTWQRCAVGQTWNGGNCDGKESTFTPDKAIKLISDFAGKTDWRLPSLRELQTIVDYTTSKPATNLIVFPDAPSSYFWTTTPKAEYNGGFWYVNFSSGANSYTSGSSYAARLVRGTLSNNGAGNTTTPQPTQTGKVDLTATLSANPSPAQKGGDLTYSANISNKGKAIATGTKITFYLAPNFMSFKNASAGCETTPLSVICNIGDLAAGGSTTKTMTVNLKKAGGISASVLVKSNEQDANPADNIGKVATGVKK